MKKPLIIGLLLLIGIAAIAYWYIRETQLVCPLKFVADPRISEIHEGSVTKLHIQGFILGVGLGCDQLVTKVHNDEMLLKLYVTFARKGHMPPIDYTVEIPPGVKRVVFGNERYQIWPLQNKALTH